MTSWWVSDQPTGRWYRVWIQDARAGLYPGHTPGRRQVSKGPLDGSEGEPYVPQFGLAVCILDAAVAEWHQPEWETTLPRAARAGVNADLQSKEAEIPVVRFARARLVDQVTEHLRDLILSGDLKPGRPLLQEELSQRLGVSRTPLREAFRVLERDGLVKSSPRSNTIEVTTFTSQDVRRMYELREVLDGLAARLVARRAVTEPEVLTRLSRAADAIAIAVRPFDTGRFLTAHVEFHSLILEAAHNPYLLQFLPTLRMSAQMLYRHLPSKPERMRTSATEHTEILDAIRSGDARKAESLARRHIRAAITSWTEEGSDDLARDGNDRDG